MGQLINIEDKIKDRELVRDAVALSKQTREVRKIYLESDIKDRALLMKWFKKTI